MQLAIYAVHTSCLTVHYARDDSGMSGRCSPFLAGGGGGTPRGRPGRVWCVVVGVRVVLRG